MKPRFASLQRVAVASICGIIQLFFCAVGVITSYRYLAKTWPDIRHFVVLVPVFIVLTLLWPIYVFWLAKTRSEESASSSK